MSKLRHSLSTECDERKPTSSAQCIYWEWSKDREKGKLELDHRHSKWLMEIRMRKVCGLSTILNGMITFEISYCVGAMIAGTKNRRKSVAATATTLRLARFD